MTGRRTSRRCTAQSDQIIQAHLSRLSALYEFKLAVNSILHAPQIGDQETASFIKYAEPLTNVFGADAELAEDIAKLSGFYNRIVEKITRLQDIRADLSEIQAVADHLIEYQKNQSNLSPSRTKRKYRNRLPI
ncbi:MAG: hypothetical protein HC887_11870 [Desulfobacteraceae bacterium]|nr:hypothetical protein [Desulfobacteraceae bacterium]